MSWGVARPDPWGGLHGVSPLPEGGGSPAFTYAPPDSTNAMPRAAPAGRPGSHAHEAPRGREGTCPARGRAVCRADPRVAGGYHGANITMIRGQRLHTPQQPISPHRLHGTPQAL